MKGAWSAFLLLAACVAVQAVDLGDAQFRDTIGTGRTNGLYMFYAPWCGHCKAMKPDFEKLEAYYEDSTSVTVGKVDCTENEALCGDLGVRGYPTLKYWLAGEGFQDAHDYESGRSYDDLAAFIEDNLAAMCSITDTKDCSEKEIKFLTLMREKTSDDVTKQLNRLNNMSASKMAPNLKKWVSQRLNILRQLAEEQ